MKRLLEFMRSVTPEDPAQLMMLGGSVLLLICMQLRSYPVSNGDLLDSSRKAAHWSWIVFVLELGFPILFAGAAGIFLSLVSTRHSVRWIVVFVLLPSVGAIGAICLRAVYLASRLDPEFTSSRIESQGNWWVLRILWDVGPAIHMGVLGIVLVSVFAAKLARGTTSLPLLVAHGEGYTSESDLSWDRISVLVWILIVGFPVLAFGFGSVLLAINRWRPVASLLVGRLNDAFVIAMLAGVAAWATGETRWRDLRQFARLPDTKFGLLGVGFPVGINLALDFASYAWARVEWAAFRFRNFAPPVFRSFFETPALQDFWYLIPAAFEEIIWRGYLQPCFVRRYGMVRGMFLLAMSWSAVHFLGDFHYVTEDYEVPLRLALRLGNCVAMSYVLGWLTVRSGSIWPAALAHGLHNVWIFSGARSFLANGYVVTACWGVLALVLFRYWPPAEAEAVAEPTVAVEPDATAMG